MRQQMQSDEAKSPSQTQSYSPVFARPNSVPEIFVNDAWQNLIRRVEILCSQIQPLITIIGAPGCGKSTLARWLYEKLPLAQNETMLISLLGREVQSGWLLPKIAKFLGAGQSQSQGDNATAATLEKLEELISEKRSLVVIIDAAEKIFSPEAFSEIESLLNLQSLAGRCLTFVLLGQPSLEQQIAACTSLATQLSWRGEIKAFNGAETRAYINDRMGQAQPKVAITINEDVFDVVFAQSQGVIARINAIMENCLIEAHLSQHKTIDMGLLAGVATGRPAESSSETKKPTTEGTQETNTATSKKKSKAPRRSNAKGTASKTRASEDPKAKHPNGKPVIALADLFDNDK